MSARVRRELLAAVAAFALGNGGVAALAAAMKHEPVAWILWYPLSILIDMVRLEPFGWWLSFGLLATACSYPVRALLALRRSSDATSERAGERRLPATLGAASSVAFVVIALVNVHVARRTPPPSPDAKVDLSGLLRFGGEIAGWSLAGAGLSILAALWGVAGILWARREPRDAAPKIAVLAALAASVSVTGASLVRFGDELRMGRFREWLPPLMRYEATLEEGAPLIQGRWALLLVAGIAAVILVILARRAPRSSAAPRGLRASAGLFVLGLAAFAGTRGFAHDAHHPPPLREPEATTALTEEIVAALAAAARPPCERLPPYERGRRPQE